MIYETPIAESVSNAVSSAAAAPAPSPHLPTGLVMLERATAALRAFLRERGLDHYVIFHGSDLDLDDVDQNLARLAPQARWESLPLLDDGDQPRVLETDNDALRLRGVGVLHLSRHEFILARWNWLSVKYNACETTMLAAAPDERAYQKLRDDLIALRRRDDRPQWEIVRNGYQQETRVRKPQPWSDLLLAQPVLARLQSDVVNFFSPPVAALYRSLNVPYRRGVLMHGPPGNGKTSIIRAIGASMPDVYAMILRPNRALGEDDLKGVFRRWRRHAPALLVLEDLDHLLKDYINLSHFLNHLDGIDGSLDGGLLMLATTNHPETLDGAINNRPGRFDVVIEIPSPEAALREQFFGQHLSDLDDQTRQAIVAQTPGLSFSHLHEVVRLSGLLAINDGLTARTTRHALEAARMVVQSHRDARNGFPVTPEVPFGLAQFRRKNEAPTNCGRAF